LGYIYIILIAILPTTVQGDKFRELDKVKGLIDYYLTISTARKILLARGAVGGIMALLIFLMTLPLAIFSGLTLYGILATILAMMMVFLQGYTTWYGYAMLGGLLGLVIMALLILIIIFGQLEIWIFLAIMLLVYLAPGALAVLGAGKDREKIVG
jgi:hypothetical protein